MVKFLNIIEGQLDTQQISIPVRAYAIQSSYTGGDKDSIPEQAKDCLLYTSEEDPCGHPGRYFCKRFPSGYVFSRRSGSL